MHDLAGSIVPSDGHPRQRVRHSLDRVGVVFVNYHSEEYIVPVVEDLRSSVRRIVVVDNSGTYPPDSVRLEAPGNIGFGAACNLGVAALPPEIDVIVFHNPDLLMDVDQLGALVSELRWDARPGLRSPMLDLGSVVRERGFGYPLLPREAALVLRTVAGRFGPAHQALRDGSSRRVRGRGRRFGSGALLVVDRRAFDQVAGFDERYFLYLEDADLWHRIRATGRTGDFSTEVLVAHGSGVGSPMGARDRQLLRWVGVELFAAQHLHTGWRAFRLLHRLGLRCGRFESTPIASAVHRAYSGHMDPYETMTQIRELHR